MEDCIFCKVIRKEVPAEIVKETERLLIFKDTNPKATVHLLLVPKSHIQDIRQVDDETWLEIKKVVLELAKEKNLLGFRLVTNAHEAALVPHMHVHFLGDVSSTREL
jgi:histidine triad (HIT) family protein